MQALHALFVARERSEVAARLQELAHAHKQGISSLTDSAAHAAQSQSDAIDVLLREAAREREALVREQDAFRRQVEARAQQLETLVAEERAQNSDFKSALAEAEQARARAQAAVERERDLARQLEDKWKLLERQRAEYTVAAEVSVKW